MPPDADPSKSIITVDAAEIVALANSASTPAIILFIMFPPSKEILAPDSDDGSPVAYRGQPIGIGQAAYL
jgi:hypothetical protein